MATADGLTVVSKLSLPQTRDLMELYAAEWWTQGRDLKAVRHMLRCTDIVVGVCEPPGRRLIAFARVLTDCVHKALVLDVIVAQRHRGSGLGKLLLDTILAHPKLARVQHFELYCRPEMVPFYEQWGFSDQLDGLRFMRRTNPATAAGGT